MLSFNPRPRTEGDMLTKRQHYPVNHGFNPRPRTEGDTDTLSECKAAIEFQSTPSHGGRPGASESYRQSYAMCFNPRPRTEGDANVRLCYVDKLPSFNPRPRTEGDTI